MRHSDEVKRICAEAYMSYVRSLALRVDFLQKEIETKKSELLPGAISLKEYVSTSTDVDAIESAICDLQELIAEYVTELAGYIDEQKVAHGVLCCLENPMHMLALHAYYLNGKTWEQVCVDLGYSWAGMMKLRKQALCEVYDLMPESWRRDPIPNAMA